MSELSPFNPTGRFSGLADLYARYRPSYPAQAIDFIIERCQLAAESLLVDVGCGTGISTRLFAERGVRAIGIEPNADMRTQAEAESAQTVDHRPAYRDGTAEATGLPDAAADIVLAAQAFHWFDREASLREFLRILKPGGWLVLMWNERDESDPFTADYGAVIRALPDAPSVEVPRFRAGEALLQCALFENRELITFHNEQSLDEEGVLGRAFSASYAPKDLDQARDFAAALQAAFVRHQLSGMVALKYQTSVYVGQKPR